MLHQNGMESETLLAQFLSLTLSLSINLFLLSQNIFKYAAWQERQASMLCCAHRKIIFSRRAAFLPVGLVCNGMQ